MTDVWVAGQRLLRARTLCTLDQAGVLAKAHDWQLKLQQHRDEQEAQAAAQAAQAKPAQ